MNTPIGEELDGRLYTDLSNLRPTRIVTPVDRFYIRTRASRLLPSLGNKWRIHLVTARRTQEITVADLERRAKPIGRVLLECAGNPRAAHFGMISDADWGGVRMSELLDQSDFDHRRARVRVTGFDAYSRHSATSTPGASWIFSIDDLSRTGAFLATTMNGQSLTPDHGYPVRLVVPGWYGCSCIKWVNAIELIREEAEATSQMLEYASRTHQTGPHLMAKYFEPAEIDLAAMPVRIEKRRVYGKIAYLVWGIVWGGAIPRTLQIQFSPEPAYKNVDSISGFSRASWNLWAHWWRPRSLGSYQINLRCPVTAERTRRLDTRYYGRSVKVSEI